MRQLPPGPLQLCREVRHDLQQHGVAFSFVLQPKAFTVSFFNDAADGVSQRRWSGQSVGHAHVCLCAGDGVDVLDVMMMMMMILMLMMLMIITFLKTKPITQLPSFHRHSPYSTIPT